MVIKLNWSKAKTILIIAFLITNMMLAVVLFSQENQEVSTIKESFIQDVIEILRKKGIYVDAEIPNEIPSLNTLTVKYEILEDVDINNRFFDGEGSIEKPSTDRSIISKESEIITIENKKRIVYKNNRENMGCEGLDSDKAKEIVFSFLEERKYNTLGMQLWMIELDEYSSEYKMKFSNTYNERYIEKAYTNVVLDKGGVLEFERLWLNPISEGETPIYINTAPKALLDLIGNESLYRKTINHISLCYYFDPKKDAYIEEPEETKEGKSIPAWRVTFTDGTKVIIDNY